MFVLWSSTALPASCQHAPGCRVSSGVLSALQRHPDPSKNGPLLYQIRSQELTGYISRQQVACYFRPSFTLVSPTAALGLKHSSQCWGKGCPTFPCLAQAAKSTVNFTRPVVSATVSVIPDPVPCWLELQGVQTHGSISSCPTMVCNSPSSFGASAGTWDSQMQQKAELGAGSIFAPVLFQEYNLLN